jgi:hypothetical protein
MNLQPVTGQAFGTQCCACHKHVTGGGDSSYIPAYGWIHPNNVFADLDGEPFRAYYCEACAAMIRAGLPGPWDSPDEFIRKVQVARGRQ